MEGREAGHHPRPCVLPRVAIAFVADSASARQVRQLGRRIAILPEVERYAFMSKDAALEFFDLRFGGQRFVARSGAGPVVSLPMDARGRRTRV